MLPPEFIHIARRQVLMQYLVSAVSGEGYEPPGKPGNLSATTVDTNHGNLEWETPESDADSIASYKIWFQVRKEEKENTSKSVAESSPGEVVEFHCTPTHLYTE